MLCGGPPSSGYSYLPEFVVHYSRVMGILDFGLGYTVPCTNCLTAIA